MRRSVPEPARAEAAFEVQTLQGFRALGVGGLEEVPLLLIFVR